MNHSPEPWHITDADDPLTSPGIADAGGHDVAYDGVLSDADAERIVLCVNACREISDQDLAAVTNPAYVARFQVDKEHNCVHLEIESDVRTISPPPPQL